MKIRRLIIDCIMIGLICLLISLLMNAVSPAGIPLLTTIRTVKIGNETQRVPIFFSRTDLKKISKAVEPTDFHPAEEININDVLSHFSEGTALIIDTRISSLYKEGHIPGALNFPVEEMDIFSLSLDDIGYSQKIITYCDGHDCMASLELALHLEELGFNDVYYFFGGWQQWTDAGYQTAKGDRP